MFRVFICVIMVAVATASPAKPAFWKGTPVDGMVDEMRSLCNDENDSFSCMKLKVMNFIDTVLKKDNYKITDDVEVSSNGYHAVDEARSEKDLFEKVGDYVQSHDVSVNIPAVGAKVTVSPRSLDNNEFDIKVNFVGGARSSVEARKSKLKKLFIPLFVFVLLKAMTLIPLALGVLGLKAWNALQLSFFSFITAFALAIFQLCKKLAADNHSPAIAAPAAWEHHGRSFEVPEVTENGSDMAYNAYA